MADLIIPDKDPLTMSSREIADLTGKEHKHVMRDIRSLQDQLEDLFGGSVQTWTHPQNGQEYDEFVLDKDTCLTLLLGYDAVARMKVVKRWQELEGSQAQPAIPQNLPEALRLAADLAEQKQIAETERDEAIRTKAHIGSKREATAMATAAKARRESEKLREELGHNARHATIIAVERATGQAFAKNAYVALRRWCKQYGIKATEVTDPRYGTVKAWPAGAWDAVFGIDLSELFGRSA